MLAAFAEIAGCFAFWSWLRRVSLATCAWLLTFVESSHAGRAYAASGSVYIAASLVWLGPSRGRGKTAGMSLVGVATIVFGARPS